MDRLAATFPAMPVLLLVGDSDAGANATAGRFAAVLTMSRTVMLENAGQLSNLEQPAAFLGTMSAFHQSNEPRKRPEGFLPDHT